MYIKIFLVLCIVGAYLFTKTEHVW